MMSFCSTSKRQPPVWNNDEENQSISSSKRVRLTADEWVSSEPEYRSECASFTDSRMGSEEILATAHSSVDSVALSANTNTALLPVPQGLRHCTVPTTLAQRPQELIPPVYNAMTNLKLGIDTTQRDFDEVICFGMLKNMRVHVTPPPEKSPLTFFEIRKDEDVFQSADLDFRDNGCDIISQEGTIVATLCKRAESMLRSLTERLKIKYQALFIKVALSAKLTPVSPTVRKDPTLPVSLLVLGPRSVGHDVAKALNTHKLYLQHPSVRPTHELYENPQYPRSIAKASQSFHNGMILPAITLDQSSRNDTKQASTIETEADLDDLVAIVNSLPAHDYLNKDREVDSRVTTSLLPHQKEAVDFALRKESGNDSDPRSLWQLSLSCSEGQTYTHKITGLRSPVATETLGGILADDMGLGKTLSMVATIVAAMPDAQKFTKVPLTTLLTTGADRRPVKSTLIIVPSALLLDGWVDEIEKHLAPGALRTYKYHGLARCLSTTSPLIYDVVLTTYGTLVADAGRGGGVLEKFHWYRVILDEAHVIRNPSTKQYKAVSSLSARVRWCLTGTPIQNTLQDLDSLLRFLKVPQFDSGKNFGRYIACKGSQKGAPKLDQNKLKMLLGSICLRRSTSILKLHGVTFVEHLTRLPEQEAKIYNGLATLHKERIRAAASSQQSQRQHQFVLIAILRLRIFCSSGTAEAIDSDAGPLDQQLEPDEILSILQQAGQAICSECGSDIITMPTQNMPSLSNASTKCRLVCPDCKPLTPKAHSESSTKADSRKVSTNAADSAGQNEGVNASDAFIGMPGINTNLPAIQSSTSKLEALLTDIQTHIYTDKSIVFSAWKQTLNVTQSMFDKCNINFCRVDGELSLPQRKVALQKFRTDASVRVLLMTLGTGGVGLNELSVASRIHLLEPQWNPSLETQAIGRIFRMGQGKEVFVVRYIIEQTIEETIRSRQIQKLQLALKGGLLSADEEGQMPKRRQEKVYFDRVGDIIGNRVAESVG